MKKRACKVTPACTRKSLNHFVSCKRSQVTIFIITAMVIIVAVILFLLFRAGVILDITGGSEENPDSFLDNCLEDKIKEAVNLIAIKGGSVNNPLHKTFKFTNEPDYVNISYLCYNQNYYLPCINQEPMLIQHLKDEVEQHISEDVKTCFDDLSSSLERNKYTVDAQYYGFEVELKPAKVVVEIEAKLTLTKSGKTSKHENFNIAVNSKFYELAKVVQEIVSQEATYCHFEHLGYMLLYPEFDIDKFRTGDLITIYTIGHRKSKEKFRFAIRGCVIPPGL